MFKKSAHKMEGVEPGVEAEGTNLEGVNDNILVGGEPGPRPKLGMVVDMSDATWIGGIIPTADAPRFAYTRPDFLYLVSEDELAVSGDQGTRPVLVPKDPSRMPLFAGYAECINAGKTPQNEDQCAARILHLAQTNLNCCISSSAADCKNRAGKRSERKRADSDCVVAETEVDFAPSLSRRYSDDDLLLEIRTDNMHIHMDSQPGESVDANYFGIFDGHAGTGAALMAANCLHEHIRERLCQVLDTLLMVERQEQIVGCLASGSSVVTTPSGKTVTSDSLVIGALQSAFLEMDEQIREEKMLWRISGGCAAIAALFMRGKLYLANAGDCRALLVCNNHSHIRPLSNDHTPDKERKRLQYIAYQKPELINRFFSRLEYSRHVGRKDIKKKVLYRDWYMDGWAAKTVRDTDIRLPLISDGMKKPRLLNTIGVSRGFGDHHLMTVDDHLPIKPFLSAVPEVQVVDLTRLDSVGDNDVLIIASDGLWDVIENEQAADIVRNTLLQCNDGDVTKYTLAAQDLLIAARGDPSDCGRWHLNHGDFGRASTDDVTVLVIPLKYAIAPPNNVDDDDDEPLLT